MNKLFRKLTLTIFCFSFIFLYSGTEVAAIGFKISPIRFDLEVAPGESVNKILKVQNKGGAANAECLVQDFLGRNESGAPTFVEGLEGETKGFALSSWITFPREMFFERDEEKEIPFTINVPMDAEPGGHYSTIFVQQKSGDISGSAVGTISRVGALIFIRVKGNIKEESKIINFDVPKEKITDESVYFVTTLENIGNIHLIPEGQLYIKDSAGNFVKDIGTAPILNIYGGIDKIVPVDYLRFNHEKKQLLLPGQKRSIETIWNKGDRTGEFSAYVEVMVGEGENKNKLTSEEVKFSIWEGLSGKLSTDQVIYIEPPVKFTVQFKNTGTTKLINTEGVLEIYNLFGALVSKVKLDIGNEENIVVDGMTQKIKKLSTKEEQVFEIKYDDFKFFGPYTAKLISGLKKDQPKVLSEVKFYAGTLSSIIGIITIMLVIILVIGFFVRSYLKLKRQIQTR